MSKTMKQIVEEKAAKGQFVDKSDPNFDAMKILYQDPISTLGTWLKVRKDSKQAGEEILRKDFWYRNRHPKDIDRVEFSKKINKLIEEYNKYNIRKSFPEIARNSLDYLIHNMLKTKKQQTKEIWGHVIICSGIETLYEEYIESLK